MDDSPALIAPSKFVFAPDVAASFKREKDLLIANEKLSAEVERLQRRLSFVEELVGPTETQRKNYQLQLTSARDAALRVAHSCAGSVPTRCVGRLDESWLRLKGLTDQECSMLQRGCVSGHDGVPCDISIRRSVRTIGKHFIPDGRPKVVFYSSACPTFVTSGAKRWP